MVAGRFDSDTDSISVWVDMEKNTDHTDISHIGTGGTLPSIGRHGSGFFCNASIDTVMIYNRALTDAEIKAIYYDSIEDLQFKTNSNSAYSTQIDDSGTVSVPFASGDADITSLTAYVPQTVAIDGVTVRDYRHTITPFEISAVINQPAIAAFSVDTTDGYSPLVATFTDHSLNTPTSWHWDFGDNTESTVQHPTHTYTTPGIYTVTLIATNADGSDTEEKTNIINVFDTTEPGVIAKEGNWSYIPVNHTKQYVLSTDQTYTVAHWLLDGVEIATTTDDYYSYTFTEPGYYNMSVFIETGSGNISVVEFHTRVGRAWANTRIVPSDDTNYNNLMNATLNLSTDGIFTGATAPFTDSIGRMFYLVLFCLPFVFIWHQTGRLTLVTTLSLITGSLFIGFIPEAFKAFIALVIVLSFASAFYKLSRGP